MNKEIVIIFLLFGLGLASTGDKQEEFQECLNQCFVGESCDRRYFTKGQPLHLRLLGWTCTHECRYRCMRTVEQENRKKGLPIYQYYGKWPFRRLFGAQELASVVFSLGNLWAHYFGYHHLYFRDDNFQNWLLHRMVRINYWVAINGWFWSAVFHTRDLYFTQVMDYVLAMAILFASATLTITRALAIRQKRRQVMLGVPIFLYYLCHMYYMNVVTFDFGWNMTVAIAAMLIYIGLFALWSMIHLYQGRRPHAKYAMLACGLMLMASSLEVLDFPPFWGIFDAHSLWHASTIPIILIWYKFYRADAEYDLGVYRALSRRSP